MPDEDGLGRNRIGDSFAGNRTINRQLAIQWIGLERIRPISLTVW